MKVIALVNNKAGVGKTTVAFNLAGAFDEAWKRTLVVDADGKGCVSRLFLEGVEDLPFCLADLLLDERRPTADCIYRTRWPLIDVVPANLSLGRVEVELLSDREGHYCLADRLRDLEGEYQIVLIDCPPSFGIVTWNALVASNGVIVPLEARGYLLKSTVYVNDAVKRVRKHANPRLKLLGYLINRFDRRRGSKKDFRKTLEFQFRDEVFMQVLKDSVKYVESVAARNPIVCREPKSVQANAVRKLAREVFWKYGQELMNCEPYRIEAEKEKYEKEQAVLSGLREKARKEEWERLIRDPEEAASRWRAEEEGREQARSDFENRVWGQQLIEEERG